MRIRRTLVAPAILTLTALGSIIMAPAVALITAAPSVATVASGSVSSDAVIMHG